MKKSFKEQFQHNVRHYGTDTAAVDSARRLSYAELDRLSGQIAGILKRKGIIPAASAKATNLPSVFMLATSFPFSCYP